MKVRLVYDELWVPTEIYPEESSPFGSKPAELPSELIDRFKVAMKEIEEIWDQIRDLQHRE